MKMKLLACMLFAFAGMPVFAAVTPSIDASSDIPMTTLFNFQVDSTQEGAFPDMYESWQDSNFWITKAEAFTASGAPNPTPWLDGPLSGKPAGVGMCQTNDCNGSSDDNIQFDEAVKLYVNTPVLVGDLYFRNGDHDTNFDADALASLSIDDSFVAFFSLAASVSDFSNLIINESISISNVGAECLPDNGGSTCEFYISGFGTPVPVPATLPMFMLGLLGLRRFIKKS